MPSRSSSAAKSSGKAVFEKAVTPGGGLFLCCTKPVGRGGRWRGVSARVGESAPGDLGVPTFHDLFREYFGQMTRLAHLLGADDAENIAQEAFVKLHQRWDTLTDHTRVTGYLCTIVVNMSRSRMRHLRVVRRSP